MDLINFLINYFKQHCEFTDCRQQSKTKYNVENILTMLFLGLLSDYKNVYSIQQFAEYHKEALVKCNLIKDLDSVPSKNTFYRILEMVSWQTLSKLSIDFLANLPSNIKDSFKKDNISKILDGKFVVGNKHLGERGVNIVTLFDSQYSVVINQENVPNKSNEKLAMRKLVNSLTAGDIVSIDAIACDSNTLEYFNKKGVFYVTGLKKNNKNLYWSAEMLFSTNFKNTNNTHIRLEPQIQNGKVIKREYFFVQADDPDMFLNLESYEKCGITYIVKEQKTTFHRRTKETVVEDRYFVSNMFERKKIAQAIREHWAIESYHWLLDTAFVEDKTVIVNQNSTTILNILRKLVLLLLETPIFKQKGRARTTILKQNNANFSNLLKKLIFFA